MTRSLMSVTTKGLAITPPLRLLVPERHHLARATALGVDEELGVGRLCLPARDVLRADTRVDVTLAHPDAQLAAGDLLAAIVAVGVDRRPPFSAPFTLWLSMIAAVGLASRPARSRHST